MKLHLLNRRSKENSSFTVKKNKYPHFLKIWHYHPELELVVLVKSTGTRFIGDSITKFEAGEVVLIGRNLPHMWLNDEVYFEESSNLEAEAIAVHFDKGFLGKNFFQTPEMLPISELFDRAERGIQFLEIEDRLVERIINLDALAGFERTVEILNILYRLAKHNHYKLLSSPGFRNSFEKTSNKDLDKIYAYVFKNFKKPIHSRDVARVIHMNPSSFSRFFKRTHRKTFTRYLNEIRVGYACKLLIEDSDKVTAVCYESGFSNISNFNRQFKAIIGMTPTAYVQRHKLE